MTAQKTPFASAPVKVHRSALYRDNEVPEEVPRDQWDRPLILVDGVLVPYTRVSTAAGRLKTTVGLEIWKRRHLALALAKFPDLTMMLAGLTYEADKKEIDRIVNMACERSEAMVVARHHGTAVHTFTDYEVGHEIREFVPEVIRPDIAAYDRAIKENGLVLQHKELFVVNDTLCVAGTFDGLYLDLATQKLVLGDKKTAAIIWGPRGGRKGGVSGAYVAGQLGSYHGGRLYDPATGDRFDLPANLDQKSVMCLHIPRSDGKAEVGRISIEDARHFAALAAMNIDADRRDKHIITPWAA